MLYRVVRRQHYEVKPGPGSCFSKKRYSTEKLARKVAHKAAQRAGKNMAVYPCFGCGGFHMTKETT